MFGRTPPTLTKKPKSSGLRMEQLEQRDNPSIWTDNWFTQAGSGIVYYGGAALEGLAEGAEDIIYGGREAVLEIRDIGSDLITINGGVYVEGELHSDLFRAAWQNGTDTQTEQNSFDNKLLTGISTLGTWPLLWSGVDAVRTGDSSQFSEDVGGFAALTIGGYLIVGRVQRVQVAGEPVLNPNGTGRLGLGTPNLNGQPSATSGGTPPTTEPVGPQLRQSNLQRQPLKGAQCRSQRRLLRPLSRYPRQPSRWCLRNPWHRRRRLRNQRK
jgi:hypothetical protein